MVYKISSADQFATNTKTYAMKYPRTTNLYLESAKPGLSHRKSELIMVKSPSKAFYYDYQC